MNSLSDEPSPHATDVAIIGAGPVGLFAVFECGMLGMRCHVIDALPEIGGQCRALYPEKPIYDIPAWPVISGGELIDKLAAQMAPFNPVTHLGEQVSALEETNAGWRLKTSSGVEINARAVVIAAGVGAFGPKRPPLDGLDICEAQGPGLGVKYSVGRIEDFRGKRVVIGGGGDSAVDWANVLADVAASVALVHRRGKFRAQPESVRRLHELASAGRVDLVTPYQLAGLDVSNGRLAAVRVADLDGNGKTLAADVLLPFYGLAQELGPILDWRLGMGQDGITVDPRTMSTDRSGIFAVGDVADYPGKLKLILSGFAESAAAAHAAHGIVFPEKALHFEYSTTKGVPAAD